MLELGNIYHMDCMEGMKLFPDKYFELAICDPPYGINFGEFNRTNKTENGVRHKANKYKNAGWDNEIPELEYFEQLKRVSKHQIIWGGNYYFNYLGNCKGLICWYKHQPVDNFSDCEFAWTSFNKPAKVFDYPYYGNIEGKTNASEKIHPTQKPIALYKWLLKSFANPGDRILDTHGGSFSSIIACLEMGFEYIAFEIDEEYYKNGLKRIETYLSQPKIFTPEQIQPKQLNLL